MARVGTNPISEINQIIHTVLRTVAIPLLAVSIQLERKSIGITVNLSLITSRRETQITP
jgi:hypothetical protein